MLPGFVPWPEDLARTYRAKGYWRNITIPGYFDDLAAASPGRVAIIDGSRRLSLSEIAEQSKHIAAHFLAHGLRAGERVVFQLPNCADFLTVFLALTRIGVIPVLALPSHRETEISHHVRSARATALLIPDKAKEFDFRIMASKIREGQPHLQKIYVLGEAREGEISLRALLNSAPPEGAASALGNLALDPDNVVLMLLSGGTTALPKLIPRTHNDYIYNFTQSARVAGFGLDTVQLIVLPLAHNYNLGSPGMLGTIALGGRVVIAPKADGATVFPLIEKEKVTTIPAAVPLVVNWLNDASLGSYDFSSLKTIQNGGARLSPELRDRLRKQLGCTYQEVYGTAEGLLNLTRLDDDDEKILMSSGAPICPDDEIKVIDENGTEVPDGERGELVTRGPYTIRGYYNAPEVNARAFTPDGLYRMGDIVTKRGRYVYADGRKGDLINRGGEKISIDEVENLIHKHHSVHSAALVAMRDPTYGERACAFVVLKPGAKLSFEELSAFLLNQQIAKFKLPERLEIMDAFPVSGAGKIMRRILRTIIEQKLEGERTIKAEKGDIDPQPSGTS